MKLNTLVLISICITSCSSFQFENKSEVNREGVRQTFVKNQQDIQDCYKKHPPELVVASKLIFDFEVDDQGRLINATTDKEKSTMHNPELGTCICEKMRTWTFPKSASTETTRILYPVYFSKGAESVTKEQLDARKKKIIK